MKPTLDKVYFYQGTEKTCKIREKNVNKWQPKH